MKKLTALFMALLLAMSMAAFTSCKDDEKNEGGKKGDYEIVDNKGWSPSFKP